MTIFWAQNRLRKPVAFPVTFQLLFSLFLSANNEMITVLVTGDACHIRSIFDVLTTVHMYITVFGL
jgi:hypothetical protein